MSRSAILFILIIIFSSGSFGQCPDRIAAYNRITELKHSKVALPEQLNELKMLIPAFEKCPVYADTVFAYLMQRVGALYSFQGDFKTAIDLSLKSLVLENANPNDISKADFKLRVYHNLQMFYDSLHLTKKKIVAVDSCIQVSISAGKINGDVLYNVWQRSDYSFDVGDYQRCIDYSKIGEAASKYAFDKADSSTFAAAFFNMHVNSLTLMHKFSEAAAMLYQMIGVYKINHAEKECGVFYNQLAEISTQKTDYDSSLYFLKKSLACNVQVGNNLFIKQSYNNIGFLYQSRLHKPENAVYYYRLALSCKNDNAENEVMDKIETMNIYDNIANGFSQKNKFDSAALFYKKAFSFLGDDIDEKKILNLSFDEFIANKKMQYVTGLIKDKGDAYLAQYYFTKNPENAKQAISVYKTCDQVLTRVKAEQAENNSGLAWRANARSLYEKAIEACHALNDTDNAFYFFEKSRSMLLMDQIKNQRHASEEDILRQNALRKELADVKSEIAKLPADSPRYADTQKKLYNLMQENDRVLETIRKRDPLYYRNFIDTSFRVIVLVNKNIVNTNHSLLEVFYGDSSIYLLFIAEKYKSLYKTDKNSYDKLTADYTNYISDPVSLNRHYDLFMQTSRNLYHLLFDSLKISTSGLIISPDGQYFPYEALIDNDQPDAAHFLIEDRSISYVYSAAYLMTGFNNAGDAKLFLGLAPVDFNASLNLSSLPASDASLHKIASLFHHPGEFVKEDASKHNFLDNFYRYRIIQLYTHASDGTSDTEPEIYFADSALKLSEIEPVFNLASRLVVLSACRTGNGTFYKGEGVFSFNRAFAGIGIPSSMVNLWLVDNQSVYQLTELFYKYLSKGLPVDISLQKAKLELMHNSSKERALPYYWAPAIIVGRIDPVVAGGSSFPWIIISAAALIILLISLFYYYKKD